MSDDAFSHALKVLPKTSVHEPLDPERSQIRLFRLQLSLDNIAPDSQLRGSLEAFDQDNCPRYQALSYTWKGPPDTDHFVIINGQYYFIRKNLYDFLQVFAKGSSNLRVSSAWTSYLWIDQLCIDQSNLSERNSQVRMMNVIYSNAKRVIAWLGPCEDEAFLEQLAKAQANVDVQREMNSTTRKAEYSANADHKVDAEYYENFCGSLTAFRYWTRLWIIQELLLARNVILLVGDQALDWDALDAAAIRNMKLTTDLDRSADVDPDKRKSIFAAIVESRHRGQSDGMPLRNALTEFAQSECEDVRDKVYGLLGVVSNLDVLEVNYELSAEEVVELVAIHLLNEHMEIMGLIGVKKLRASKYLLGGTSDVAIERLAQAMGLCERGDWISDTESLASYKEELTSEASHGGSIGSERGPDGDYDDVSESRLRHSDDDEDDVDERRDHESIESFTDEESDGASIGPMVVQYRYEHYADSDCAENDIMARIREKCLNEIDKRIEYFESDEYKLAVSYYKRSRGYQ